jgi:phosphoribosyl 1,2-cyclic phosphodiesterase
LFSFIKISFCYIIKPVFKNVDHILVECNFNDLDEELEEHDTRRLESHMSLNTLKKLIPRWNLDKTKTITLIHLSDTRADSELMQREIAELTGKKVLIAKKGLIIE